MLKFLLSVVIGFSAMTLLAEDKEQNGKQTMTAKFPFYAQNIETRLLCDGLQEIHSQERAIKDGGGRSASQHKYAWVRLRTGLPSFEVKKKGQEDSHFQTGAFATVSFWLSHLPRATPDPACAPSASAGGTLCGHRRLRTA
jgi:hypothetical protein